MKLNSIDQMGQVLIELIYVLTVLLGISFFVLSHLKNSQQRFRKLYPNHEVIYDKPSEKAKNPFHKRKLKNDS